MIRSMHTWFSGFCLNFGNERKYSSGKKRKGEVLKVSIEERMMDRQKDRLVEIKRMGR